VKFYTPELHTIKLSSCQFPENRALIGALYVEGCIQLYHSFYIFHPISTKKWHNLCPQKFVKWLCALEKPAQWHTHTHLYIVYILFSMVWYCCCT